MGRDGRGVKGASESSIEITFTYRNKRCRERIALKPTPANLKRAEQHRAAILHAIATNSFNYAATFPNSANALKFASKQGEVIKLEAFLEAWFDRQTKHLKASTLDGYRKIITYQLIPWFGHMRISDFKKKDMRAKLDMLDVSNKRMANIQSVMRTALEQAINDDLIDINPLANWCYTRKQAPKNDEEVDPFNKDEQAAILEAAKGQAKNFIQFALWTGLRTSELVALDWCDIDWIRGVVIVNKALTQAADEPELPKTTSSKREVKLLDGAFAALTNQKQFTFLKGKEVFQNPNYDQRWTGDEPIRKTMWASVIKRAKVRYRKPYQTRHTYASMMLSAGEHPMWVAKQMGHADWAMIARVYGKWMPEADTLAGSRAEEKFGIKRKNDNITPATTRKPA